MAKIPQYLSFFEPIFFGILLCFLPELEYFFFPAEDRYSAPMLYLFIILWAICIAIITSPLKQLVKDKFVLSRAAQNIWLRNLKQRSPNLDQALILRQYKFPSPIQLIFPGLLMVGGIAWLIYPMLNGNTAIYPYAFVPILLGYKGASTIIKYNSFD